MSMSPRDWLALASVYQAGADNQRAYEVNTERQQQAGALEAMAARCEELSRQRNMTPEQLEEARRNERQQFVPRGSRMRCKVFVEADQAGRPGLCLLHRDHVLDGTDHGLGPAPEPLPWPGRS